MVFAATPTHAAGSETYTPWTFIGAASDCGTNYPAGTPGGASAVQNSNGSVTLAKNAPTSDCSSAGVTFNNVPTTVTSLSFNYSGYCGAGAPRFNVYTSNHGTIFLGCTYGDPTHTGTATFTAGQTYGGVLFPADSVVTGIDLLQDEQGSVTVSNLKVNGTAASLQTNRPTSVNDCTNYGNFTDASGTPFASQAACVAYFQTLSANGGVNIIGNGSGSVNSVSVSSSNSTSVTQSNTTTNTNRIRSRVNTGGNVVAGNTGTGTTLTTGGGTSTVTLTNGGSANSAMLTNCGCGNIGGVTVGGNGSNSVNLVDITKSHSVTAGQYNTQTNRNKIRAIVHSGHNVVAGNTGGTTTTTTGTGSSTVSATNNGSTNTLSQ